MDHREAVVRIVAGKAPRKGAVLSRPAPRRGTLTVRWSDGREEAVAARDPSLRFAPAQSRQLDWLMAPRRLRRDFGHDPAAVVATVIRESDTPIATTSLKNALVRLGLDRSDIDAVWPKARAAMLDHPNVVVVGQHLRWSEEPFRMPPLAALDELVSGKRLTPARKRALAEAVRAGLGGTRGDDDPPVPQNDEPPEDGDAGVDAEVARLKEENDRMQALLRATHHQQVSFRDVQDRQLKIDAVRALAELAIEVEDLAVNGAEPDIIVERVRALAELSSLEPIGLSGEAAAFDPSRHSPLATHPDAGAPVSVVRPGYTWHAGDEDVLIEKAIVD